MIIPPQLSSLQTISLRRWSARAISSSLDTAILSASVRIDLEDMFIEYRLRTSTTFSTGTETHVYMRQFDQGVTEDRTFIDAIKSGDGSKIRSPYSDAIKTLKLGFAANKSMETGKVISSDKRFAED